MDLENKRNTFQVRFLPQDILSTVASGTDVLQAEILAGLHPDAPCGGNGKCGKCRVEIDGKTVLACQTIVDRDMTVSTTPAVQEVQILTEGRSMQTRLRVDTGDLAADGNCLAAFDIGTTTIVGYFMERATGTLLHTVSRMNPQYIYGADVISRADYVLEHGAEGQDALQQAICLALDEMIGEACETMEKKRSDIAQISIVGNTCMHHLLLGLSPETLVKAPYVPLVKEAQILNPDALGLQIDTKGRVLIFPNIAGFVGGDTVGCLLSCRPDLEEDITLLVDIGTNGEMALGNKARVLTTSTAAGPAFEGAKITCGMRGTKGAVSHVRVTEEGLELEVIGGGKIAGICGSGLIDLMAFLIRHGIVNSMGAFRDIDDLEDPIAIRESNRILAIDGRPAFVLARPEESVDGSFIYFSQKDIREVQLAKAAIASGIEILSAHLGISCDQIKKVYLAGAFGNYMDAENACEIGLLPWELHDRIIGVGNAAGEGARLAVLNEQQFQLAGELAASSDFVELASEKTFQDIFVEQLEFARGIED